MKVASTPLGSGRQADRIAGPDPAGTQHLGVDAGARFGVEVGQRPDPVVPGDDAEGFGVPGQVTVGQGGYRAAGGPGDHPEHEVVADGFTENDWIGRDLFGR